MRPDHFVLVVEVSIAGVALWVHGHGTVASACGGTRWWACALLSLRPRPCLCGRSFCARRMRGPFGHRGAARVVCGLHLTCFDDHCSLSFASSWLYEHRADYDMLFVGSWPWRGRQCMREHLLGGVCPVVPAAAFFVLGVSGARRMRGPLAIGARRVLCVVVHLTHPEAHCVSHLTCIAVHLGACFLRPVPSWAGGL